MFSLISYRDCRFHADIVADTKRVQKVIGNDNSTKDALIIAELESRISSMAELEALKVRYQSHIGRTRDCNPEGQPSSSETEVSLALHCVVNCDGLTS